MITVGMKKVSNIGRYDRTGPMVAIREARAEDVPVNLDVINATNEAFYEAIVPPDRYREPFLALEDIRAESRRMTFDVFEQNDRTFGVIGLEGRTRGIGVIGRLYVLPELQRTGVGTALLAYVEAAAKQKRLREIEPQTTFADACLDDRVRQHPDTLLVLRKSL